MFFVANQSWSCCWTKLKSLEKWIVVTHLGCCRFYGFWIETEIWAGGGGVGRAVRLRSEFADTLGRGTIGRLGAGAAVYQRSPVFETEGWLPTEISLLWLRVSGISRNKSNQSCCWAFINNFIVIILHFLWANYTTMSAGPEPGLSYSKWGKINQNNCSWDYNRLLKNMKKKGWTLSNAVSIQGTFLPSVNTIGSNSNSIYIRIECFNLFWKSNQNPVLFPLTK